MSVSYGCTRTFGTTTYGVEGMSSSFRALLFVYRQAHEDGNYTVPALREKWWQIWRPTEYSEIDKALLGLPYEEDRP